MGCIQVNKKLVLDKNVITLNTITLKSDKAYQESPQTRVPYRIVIQSIEDPDNFSIYGHGYSSHEIPDSEDLSGRT